eukprot:comp19061_c0_seq1/m.35316 comp19061_c0_seq1/g.35316  ORF comp19061_c0_seq1/g.35316 comp19061_c0_seq1/m.35316 type:complete len:325 (+) comp19061_c0_seq1:837-1811(+)
MAPSMCSTSTAPRSSTPVSSPSPSSRSLKRQPLKPSRAARGSKLPAATTQRASARAAAATFGSSQRTALSSSASRATARNGPQFRPQRILLSSLWAATAAPFGVSLPPPRATRPTSTRARATGTSTARPFSRWPSARARTRSGVSTPTSSWFSGTRMRAPLRSSRATTSSPSVLVATAASGSSLPVASSLSAPSAALISDTAATTSSRLQSASQRPTSSTPATFCSATAARPMATTRARPTGSSCTSSSFSSPSTLRTRSRASVSVERSCALHAPSAISRPLAGDASVALWTRSAWAAQAPCTALTRVWCSTSHRPRPGPSSSA